MLDQVKELLGLPFDVLALISAGYLAYRIAYTGKDSTHSTIDVLFLTFVYAFIAQVTAIAGVAITNGLEISIPSWAAASAGLFAALCSAAIWRTWGEDRAFAFLRWLGVSAADRQITAWQSVLARGAKNPSQLIVKKTDGTLLMSERLGDFEKAPLGPCLLGQDGSVALYVTDTMAKDGEWEKREPFDSEHADWGYVLTYIPASHISEIRLRTVS